MNTEMHEVVRLLIARMESHPEEFQGVGGPQDAYAPVEDRWWRAKELVREYGTKEENAVVRTAMRKLMLNVAHEWMMDELCNGEARRRKRKEEEDLYNRQQGILAQQNLYANKLSANMKQASDYYTQQALSQLNALGNYTATSDLAQNAIAIKNHDTKITTKLDRDDLANANSPIATIRKALGI